ncbi:hypothetical protein HY643_00675 [Candidatus Woesearchaeota archaeon]|nr:hypothetical protein [Candidatus Woesearchaeota archaeon]
MQLLSFTEIVSMLVLTVVLAYIFMDYIKRPGTIYSMYRQGFSWGDFKFAALVAAPAVILHELGHKFVALAFGLPASFQIFWGGLGLAVILKLVHSPFLILAPAYVLIPSSAAPVQHAFIAAAGPLVNLALWFLAAVMLKGKRKKNSEMKIVGWHITKQLNMWLFIFNMIPIPPLDGYNVLRGIMGMF